MELQSRTDFDRLTRGLADARSELAAARSELAIRQASPVPAGAGALEGPKTLTQQFKELTAMRRLAAEFAEEFGGGGKKAAAEDDESTLGKFRQMAELGETTGELIRGLVQGWRGANPPGPQHAGYPPQQALPPAQGRPMADPQQATADQVNLEGVDTNALRKVVGVLQAYYDSGKSPAETYAELAPMIPVESVDQLRGQPVEAFVMGVALGAEADSSLRRREATPWLGAIHQILCSGGAVPPPSPRSAPPSSTSTSGPRRASDVIREQRAQANSSQPE